MSGRDFVVFMRRSQYFLKVRDIIYSMSAKILHHQINDEFGTSQLPGRPSPFDKQGEQRGSYLADDTMEIEDIRLQQERKGHQKFGKVHGDKHELQQQGNELGEEYSPIEEHPFFADQQRVDGLPEPLINSKARIDFDLEKAEQKKRHELRKELQNELNYTATPSFSPRPKGPG